MCACVVFSSRNPTAYLACFSVSPLWPNSTFVILCSFLLSLMFSHVKCWVAPSFCTECSSDARPGVKEVFHSMKQSESQVVLGWYTYVPKITSGL